MRLFHLINFVENDVAVSNTYLMYFFTEERIGQERTGEERRREERTGEERRGEERRGQERTGEDLRKTV